jgi:hypothetical protein
MADRRYSVPVGDKLVYYGTWDHDPSKYRNFKVMFETARSQLVEFEATKARISADDRLSEKGKAEALGQAVREFETMRSRFLAGPVKDRKPQVLARLRELRGGRQRNKDDVAGQLADQELRVWYRGLEGDAKVQINGAMTRGELPEVASALLRMPDQVVGLRPDLREQLEQVSIEPHNVEAVTELRTELGAIEQAEAALEKTRAQILGMARETEAVHQIEAAAALEDAGLQKVEGKEQVEPFVEPAVEPLPVGEDGVIDLAIKPKSDAA